MQNGFCLGQFVGVNFVWDGIGSTNCGIWSLSGVDFVGSFFFSGRFSRFDFSGHIFSVFDFDCDIFSRKWILLGTGSVSLILTVVDFVSLILSGCFTTIIQFFLKIIYMFITGVRLYLISLL